MEKTLARLGVKRIDAVFLTHAHPDHVGGMGDLSARWRIDALYLPEIERDPVRWSDVLGLLPGETKVASLHEGDSVTVGPFDFLVLGPPADRRKDGDENAGSLQLLVTGGGVKALFTGDAPWDQVHPSLNGLAWLNLIKIPHHGSKSGFPPSGLDGTISRLRSQGKVTAVFPAPRPGPASLPSREVVEWFERRGIPCLFTGEGDGVFLKFRESIQGFYPRRLEIVR